MKKPLEKLKKRELFEIILGYLEENNQLKQELANLKRELEEKQLLQQRIKELEAISRQLEAIHKHLIPGEHAQVEVDNYE